MTKKSLQTWARVGAGIAEHVRQYVGVRDARIEALERRIAELEARKALDYAGTWSSGTASKAGSFYTDRGSIWFCRGATVSRPGESAHWQLACKSGRDAR
jgi:hypothetical protein